MVKVAFSFNLRKILYSPKLRRVPPTAKASDLPDRVLRKRLPGISWKQFATIAGLGLATKLGLDLMERRKKDRGGFV